MRDNSKTINEILCEYSKNILEDLYWNQKKTTREVALIIGTSQPTIRKLFSEL